jgi:hypothetical protein
MLLLWRSAATLALLCCVALPACGGDARPVPASADSTPTVTLAASTATALLDGWQRPLLATLRRHRVPATSYARDARLAAALLHDDDLARAVQRSGESWTTWAGAVKERRGRAEVAHLFARAVQDYETAYRTADSEPPAGFRLD